MRTAPLLSGLAVSSAVEAALTPVKGFTGLGLKGRSMYVHQGAAIPAGAPIVLMIHPCLLGVRPWYSATSEVQRHADELGVHLLYPSTTNDNSCWDVSTKASLTHNGGSDSKNIIQMVEHLVKEKKADKDRVYAIGSSSGAMMTNVLMAAYPDVLKGGASFSGVAAGCLAQSSCAASGCSSPMSDKSACAKAGAKRSEATARSAKAWGDIARNAYPGYSGERPKTMIWHGTSDNVVSYVNLADALKQWSDVHGVQVSKNISDSPKSGYTKIVYGDGTKLVGYSAKGVGHTVPAGDRANYMEVFRFFGLEKGAAKGGAKGAASSANGASQGKAPEAKGAEAKGKTPPAAGGASARK